VGENSNISFFPSSVHAEKKENNVVQNGTVSVASFFFGRKGN
jgi:hypothetical protein